MRLSSDNSKKEIRFGLQTKLLVGILLLEMLLFTPIILVVEHEMRKSVLDEFLKRGLAVSQNLAAVNTDYLSTYNYVKIDQHLEQALRQHGLLYAVILLFDGEIASYQEQAAYREQVLGGELQELALLSQETLIQYGQLRNSREEFCDISVPIMLEDTKWGTVRVGFSLSSMYNAIANTRKVILILGIVGLVLGYLAAIFLARRIIRPFGKLVASVESIATGAYDTPINITTHDEIGFLGRRFAELQKTLKEQVQLLARTNRRLVTSNQQLQSAIVERQKKDEQIHYLAFYDNVTKLPNRALLVQHLTQMLRQCERFQRELAVLFLDLDHFKRVNDTLGHTAGDQLLREVACRLTRSIRAVDYLAREGYGRRDAPGDRSENSIVARLGGDEFVVVLSELHSIEDAAKVAGRIIKVLAEPFMIEGVQVFISSSIGISGYPIDGDDIETLLKQADIAMYHVKDQGRNGYQFYTTTMNTRAQERLMIENYLRESLEKKEHFTLHYQPKIDVRRDLVVGMEALLRWNHPELGSVSPVKFIPIAEETGLIVPLGEWVLRNACAQNKTWQTAGLPPLRLSVNLSAGQFKRQDLQAIVDRVLRETRLEANYLELELTESLLMESIDGSISILQDLKALGVWLSIDDFGTGYSSLSYLKRFPIDILKIDRSFIRDIAIVEGDAAIVDAIITLGHSLGLKVIAEGVETEKQLEFLCKQECDEIQGFLINQPLPADKFAAFVQENLGQSLLCNQQLQPSGRSAKNRVASNLALSSNF